MTTPQEWHLSAEEAAIYQYLAARLQRQAYALDDIQQELRDYIQGIANRLKVVNAAFNPATHSFQQTGDPR